MKKAAFDVGDFTHAVSEVRGNILSQIAWDGCADKNPLMDFLIGKGVSEEIAHEAQIWLDDRVTRILADAPLRRGWSALQRLDGKSERYLKRLEETYDALNGAIDKLRTCVWKTDSIIEELTEEIAPNECREPDEDG